VARWQPYPFPLPFPQTGTNPHRYESGRTQNESGRDGKGESGRDGERKSGRDGKRESGQDDERESRRDGERESRRDDEGGKRESGRDVEGASHPRTRGRWMTRPRMKREECVKGENGMVSRNSEWRKRELTKNIQIRKEGPRVCLGPYVRAIAAERECSGRPLEVVCDASGSADSGTRRDEEGLGRRDLELSNTFRTPKSTVGILENPRHSDTSRSTFFSPSPLAPLSVHRHPLPHLKYESEGSFSPTPTPG
jgi:hypothetical protein